MNYILKYIKKKCLHATVLGGLSILINYILEYIKVEVALFHIVRGIKYFYKINFRLY